MMFAKIGANNDKERIRTPQYSEQAYNRQNEISWGKDKPSKPTHVWEKSSIENNTKAFWESYEMTPVQPWPVTATGWGVKDFLFWSVNNVLFSPKEVNHDGSKTSFSY